MAHAVAVRSHAAIYKRRLPPTRHTSGSHRLHQRRCAQSRSRRHEASTKKAHAPPPGCACRSWAPLQCFPRKLSRTSCITTAVSCDTRALKSGANVHIEGARASFGGLARATEKTMHQGSPERGEESERGPLSSTLNQLLSSALRQTCSDGTHPVPR